MDSQNSTNCDIKIHMKYNVPNQFMLRDLAEGIHLWSLVKPVNIVSHAETASFTSDDVIRNSSFDSEIIGGLSEDLRYKTLRQN